MQRLVHRTDRHRLELRFKEHIRYITSNNPVLGYALYILHNAHENGPTETSMTLLHSAQKKINVRTHWKIITSITFTNII